MSSSSSELKARHYQALAGSLRYLKQDLAKSEYLMSNLAEHLQAMQRMGTHSAAQFMAVSRLLDKQLLDEAQKREGEQQTQA